MDLITIPNAITLLTIAYLIFDKVLQLRDRNSFDKAREAELRAKDGEILAFKARLETAEKYNNSFVAGLLNSDLNTLKELISEKEVELAKVKKSSIEIKRLVEMFSDDENQEQIEPLKQKLLGEVTEGDKQEILKDLKTIRQQYLVLQARVEVYQKLLLHKENFLLVLEVIISGHEIKTNPNLIPDILKVLEKSHSNKLESSDEEIIKELMKEIMQYGND